MMKSLFRRYWYLTVVALLMCASASFAQDNLYLSGVNGASLGPAYTDPYMVSINKAASVQAVCDDWADNSYLYESWTANATNLASAGTSSSVVKWNSNITSTNSATVANGISGTQLLYDEVAYLTTELLAAAPGTAQEDLSYALWQLTCTEGTSSTHGAGCSDLPFSQISGTDLTNATNEMNAAEGATYTAGEYSNFTIFTPTGTTGNCNGATCPPQEFIVETPESSAGILLGADMIGLLGLAFVFRRRLLRPIL
jgi:hypothetical protein